MISQLIRAWAIIGQQLLGMFPSITGYRPAAYTSDGIKSAMARCLAMGGGTVKLGSHVYTGSTGTSADDIDVTQYPGVSVIGTKPAFTSTSNVSIASEVYLSGARIINFGFYGNNVSQASPAANFGANAIQGIKIIDILFSNCTRRALDFGAHNNMGLNLCEIDVVMMDCGAVDYAASFVNFANCHTMSVLALNSSANLTGGGVQFISDVDSVVFIPGNSTIRGMTESYYRKNRGFEFGVIGTSILNSLQCPDLQTNKYGQSSFTQNAVFTSASTSIAVTNCEEVQPGMPVRFTTTANGVTAGNTYSVITASALTGAGNITIGTDAFSTAITASGSSTLSMVSSGYPCITIYGNSPTYNVQSSEFNKLDLESINAINLHATRTKECVFNLAEITSSADQAIVLRNTTNCTTHTQNPATKLDFDAVSASTHRNFGSYNNTPQQYLGSGIMNGHTLGSRGATVAAGAAAGTGATATNSAGVYDNYGQITLTPQGTPTAGVVATLIFKQSKESSCVILTPANAAANALSGAGKIRAQTTSRGTGFDLVVDTALVAGTAYVINWQAP